MERTKVEINKYVQEVVRKTRRDAAVDTGFLSRSIRGNYYNGMVTFREIFYGAYNNNAQLVQNAKAIMPTDIQWQVVFVDEDGKETPIEGKTKTGRKISRKSVNNENVSTKNIKALISAIKANGKKEDGTGETDRESDRKAS